MLIVCACLSVSWKKNLPMDTGAGMWIGSARCCTFDFNFEFQFDFNFDSDVKERRNRGGGPGQNDEVALAYAPGCDGRCRTP